MKYFLLYIMAKDTVVTLENLPVEWEKANNENRLANSNQLSAHYPSVSIFAVIPQAKKRVRMVASVPLILSLKLLKSAGLTSAMSAMTYAISPFESEYCFSTL
jgi:hypothetical protein